MPLAETTGTALRSFRALGLDRQEAFDTVRALLYAEVRGGKSQHGLDRFPWIERNLGTAFVPGRPGARHARRCRAGIRLPRWRRRMGLQPGLCGGHGRRPGSRNTAIGTCRAGQFLHHQLPGRLCRHPGDPRALRLCGIGVAQPGDSPWRHPPDAGGRAVRLFLIPAHRRWFSISRSAPSPTARSCTIVDMAFRCPTGAASTPPGARPPTPRMSSMRTGP